MNQFKCIKNPKDSSHLQFKISNEKDQKKENIFSSNIQKASQINSISFQQNNVIEKKKTNNKKPITEENFINHCTCCQFFKPDKQRKLLENITKQIIFIEDDFDTYLLHQDKQNERKNRMNEIQCASDGVYFSKDELQALNQGSIKKLVNQGQKNYQGNYDINHNHYHQSYIQNRFLQEEEDCTQNRKSFFLNTAHNRTNSYDSCAHAPSKSWLEQISEEREEQESQLTFQNKNITHANSSQNLKSENRYLQNSYRNSLGNNQNFSNGNNTVRSSHSGGDNERSLSSLYSYQNTNLFGFQQTSQQNTPQVSIIAPSLGSSSSYLPQQSQNMIDSHQNYSELQSNQQLSMIDQQFGIEQIGQYTTRKRNQHFRSQSCPFSVPYFKYNSNQNTQNNCEMQNIRVMTIHEEEPYHNYVHNNSSNYNCSSNNSTRNKYRQQQPFRQNQPQRSNSQQNSNSNMYQNTSYTPNSFIEDKKQLIVNSFLHPCTNTEFCFDSNYTPTPNLQADENQYLQESFNSYVQDGDNKEDQECLQARKDQNTVNISNKPSLDNKFERDHDESQKEVQGIKQTKNQGQKLSIQLNSNGQNARFMGASLFNEIQNNSNSCSLNLVKSINQLESDQGFISFRNENSLNSSQQEEGLVANMNIRSSHNSIEVDLKLKIRDNISLIKKKQILKRKLRLESMRNKIFKDSDKEIQDFLNIATNKTFSNNINNLQNAKNSFTYVEGQLSNQKLPTLPLLASYQGSTNSHSTLSSTLFSIVQPYSRGYARGNNFWSYDFSYTCDKNKSFLSNENLQPLKKGGEEENKLRQAIVEGFMMNQKIQQETKKNKNYTSLSNQIKNELLTQPTANFIPTDVQNLQLPSNISYDTYQNGVVPFSTPASFQNYKNNEIKQCPQTFNNFEMKQQSQVNIVVSNSETNNLNAINTFNNKSYNDIQNSANSMIVSSKNNINNSDHNNSNSMINNKVLNSNINDKTIQNNLFLNNPTINNSHTKQNVTNKNESILQNNIKQKPFIITNHQSCNIQQTNSMQQPHQTQQHNINSNQNNQLNHQTSPSNSQNSLNINTPNNQLLLNRISEECESPANTTYKQHQEYLNYESEHYLTGSKSQYHKKQQLLASGESHNTSKPIEDDSAQTLHHQEKQYYSLFNQQNMLNPQRIEKISSTNQLQQTENQKQYLQQNNNTCGQQSNITTVFNLLNHTIANPHNLNQSQQQNPSANNSWFESSRSYEILMLEENKVRGSYLDGQTLSFSKLKNVPSSHLSSQKSLHGINSNMQNNQENNDINLNLQNNYTENNIFTFQNRNLTIQNNNNNDNFNNQQNNKNLGCSFANNLNPSQVYLNRIRIGENTPKRLNQNEQSFNQSPQINDSVVKENQNNQIRKKEQVSTIRQQKQTENQGFQIPSNEKSSDNEIKTTSSQKICNIVQNLTKSLNKNSIMQDLSKASISQKEKQNQPSKKNLSNLQQSQPFSLKTTEQQSQLYSGGYNCNSNSQNKTLFSTNNFKQNLNSQVLYKNQDIKNSEQGHLDQKKSLVQTVQTSFKDNKQAQPNMYQVQSNTFQQNNLMNNNLDNNIHNNMNTTSNIINNNINNNNFAMSQRSSTTINNSHRNFIESQGMISFERASQEGLSIEIQIERRQNNHNLLIQALKKQLQDSRPRVLEDIEEHIRSHPNYCFILALQENHQQQTVLKGLFHVQSQTSAKKSFQIENLPNLIRIEDVEEFLNIDRDEYFFEFTESPGSFRKVEAVILKSINS